MNTINVDIPLSKFSFINIHSNNYLKIYYSKIVYKINLYDFYLNI